jgi:hypothetical protein
LIFMGIISMLLSLVKDEPTPHRNTDPLNGF